MKKQETELGAFVSHVSVLKRDQFLRGTCPGYSIINSDLQESLQPHFSIRKGDFTLLQ